MVPLSAINAFGGSSAISIKVFGGTFPDPEEPEKYPVSPECDGMYFVVPEGN